MAKSEYLQREEAAKKQLGARGVKKRVKQLPRATRATARGLLREVTGIDVSRKGVSVSPESLAMALPVGKVLKAAKALRAAGKVSQAAALDARILAKQGGKMDPAEVDYLQNIGEWGPVMKAGRRTRLMSENIFPKTGNYTFAGTFNRYGDMLPKATRKARGIKRVNPQAE